MSGHRLGVDREKALRVGIDRIANPGSGGTVDLTGISGSGGVMVIDTAITVHLPDPEAGNIPYGYRVIAINESAGTVVVDQLGVGATGPSNIAVDEAAELIVMYYQSGTAKAWASIVYKENAT